MLSDQDDVWKKEKVEKTVEKLKQENAKLKQQLAMYHRQPMR